MVSRPILGFFACVLSGVAAQVNAAPKCQPLSFMMDDALGRTLRGGKIVGDGRAYFLRDGEGCPAPQGCRLERQPYLIKGDPIAVDLSRPGFVCAHFSNGRSELTGWLPADRIQETLPTNPPASAWTGTWHLRENEIRLQAMGDRVHGEGDAVWQGPNPNQVHVGNFSADAMPADNHLRFVADAPAGECRLSLTLLADLLAVTDNQGCGGQNVTFSGLYARKK
jgi:hypothetical protein